MKSKFKLVVFNKLSMLDRWVKGFNMLDSKCKSSIHKTFHFMEVRTLLQKAEYYYNQGYDFNMIDLEEHALMSYHCEMHNQYLQDERAIDILENNGTPKGHTWVNGQYKPNHEVW